MPYFLKNYTKILLLFLIFFIIGSILIYKNEEKKLEKEIDHILTKQTYLIKGYFDVSKSLIYTFKNSIETNLLLNKQNTRDNIIQTHNNSYNIQYKMGTEQISSTLNGIGNVHKITKEHKNEIDTVLELSPIFYTAIKKLPDIEWIYYSSQRNFIYLAQTDFIADDKFIKEQFKKNFWIEAHPNNNPNKDLILTKLYIDGVGKGLLTTLSLPIHNPKKEFIGVVSIDMGLDKLNKILSTNKLIGEIYLINHNDYIIASTSNFNRSNPIDLNDENFINSTYKTIDILNKKIRLIYTISNKEKYSKTIKNAMSDILLLLFILSIIYMTYHLTTLINKIEELANKDSLTLLLNRRALRKESIKHINISKKYNKNISFLLLDLDNFKMINDTYGHQIGDVVLKNVAIILKEHSRNTDFVSRYGGEEFLVCLTNTNIINAYNLAEKIRKEIHQIKIDNLNINISVSIGCIEHNKKESLDNAIHRADKLLYIAKNKGKNQTQI